MVFEQEYEDELRRRAKVQLRKRMRALRNSIPRAALAERSARIVERLASHELFARASTVALFSPILDRNEVDVRPLDALSRAQGKAVAYPLLLEGTGEMTLLVASSDELVDRGFGFLEPPAEAPPAVVDDRLLVVVPALAVDERGHRIGYGKGFYDRLLERISPPATAVAVAFDFQVVAEVPAMAGDQPLGWIFTDARALPRS